MLESRRTMLYSLLPPSYKLSNNIVSNKLSSYILSPCDLSLFPRKIYKVAGATP